MRHLGDVIFRANVLHYYYYHSNNANTGSETLHWKIITNNWCQQLIASKSVPITFFSKCDLFFSPLWTTKMFNQVNIEHSDRHYELKLNQKYEALDKWIQIAFHLYSTAFNDLVRVRSSIEFNSILNDYFINTQIHVISRSFRCARRIECVF